MSGSGALTGSCHCGAVTVDVPRAPDYLGRCNCSMCTRTAAAWGYYDPAEVQLSDGPLDSYIRADMAEPCLAVERCATCGCIVRWRAIVPLDPPRMGVNMNLFDPDDLGDLEIRFNDGKSWPLG